MKHKRFSELPVLRGTMATLALTQGDLAEAIGMTETYVCHVIAGKSDPNLSVCKLIYNYLSEEAKKQNRTIPEFGQIFLS